MKIGPGMAFFVSLWNSNEATGNRCPWPLWGEVWSRRGCSHLSSTDDSLSDNGLNLWSGTVTSDKGRSHSAPAAKGVWSQPHPYISLKQTNFFSLKPTWIGLSVTMIWKVDWDITEGFVVQAMLPATARTTSSCVTSPWRALGWRIS